MSGSTQNQAQPSPRPKATVRTGDESSVVARLKQKIRADGPITVANFMDIALSDQDGGYYATRDPLGVAGDFTTAPEISQIFGELVGLWCVDTWQSMGAPSAFAVVELGPGRGTLMADALRAMRQVSTCRAAASVHLVETSPVLRESQQRMLAGENITWHTSLPDLGRMPAIYIANEFFDALPVHQYVKLDGDWCERVIALDPTHERFCFALDRNRTLPVRDVTKLLADAEEGTVFEYSPTVRSSIDDIAHRLFLHGGASLIIDYGYTRHATGQTLQAVRKHRPVDPLDEPGNCDLTAHVNFQLLAETATSAGIKVWGPIDQGNFLQKLGIQTRAATLLKTATVSQAHDIRTAVTRLISPAEMGALFKVMALSDSGVSHLAGFEPDA
jgi:NADH dehydrogenase [ubiquinone] 1 alpha subcomplex assembly factor 7